MELPTLAKAQKLATHLLVLDQASGRMVPFVLTADQVLILETLLVATRLTVLKGRQIGSSTVCAYFLMLVALLNPGLPLAVVADKQDKSDAILLKVRQWLGQLGIALSKKNVRSLELPNGASITALSAISSTSTGESKVGRSASYGVVLQTEKAFWSNPEAVEASLSSTALKNAVLIDESTGAPGEDNAFKRSWDNAETRLFFSCESHPNYREDPASITDAQYAQLQTDYGFTRRDTAAWWHRKLMVDFKGDTHRMLREFPVTPAHAFTFRVGLWLERYEETTVTEVGDWNIYSGLEPEPLIASIDTSAGLGQDASAIVLLGQKTGRVHRTWRNNTTPIPAFIDICKLAIGTYKPVATIVESNGVGQAVFQSLALVKGANVVEQKSSNNGTSGELHLRMSSLKGAIESAEFNIGGHLLMEAKSASIDKHGRFTGMDDALFALSFATKWRALNPYRAPVIKLDPREFYVPVETKKSISY